MTSRAPFQSAYAALSPRTSLRSSVALLAACAVLAVSTAGCTPAQKQTTLQIVTQISIKAPVVVSAADTVAATLAALDPAEALLIGVADTAFDTGAQAIESLSSAYLANPNATTLQQIQTAINTLESQVNTATLNAVGIKNAAHQRLALAALKALLTAVTILFALLAPTQTTAQLEDLRRTDTIHLAKLRPYMDERELQRAAREQGLDVDQAFHRAAAFGF